jgi:Family of unknown function (DUF6002)
VTSVLAPGQASTSVKTVLHNALAHYYPEIRILLRQVGERSTLPGFGPGFELPELDDAMIAFLEPSTLAWQPLGVFGQRRLSLLDLRSNPDTRTTKTNASLLIVARAVAYIRRTGERIMIVTPSSANKATALRSAVLRAIKVGLVEPHELQITTVVPAASLPKLWESDLSGDPAHLRRNPMLVLPGQVRMGVKDLVQRFAAGAAAEVDRATETRLWFSLALDNYRGADAVRSFFEQDFLPGGTGRVHAHSVSSAFGLLGHHAGAVHRGSAPDAQYLLVQHLDTPDMVLDLYHDDFSRERIPSYAQDPASGLWRQSVSPAFPATTFDPNEVLEPTFYTHRPATSAQMKQLIRTQGGAGIVVSLHECLQRYPAIRQLLGAAEVALPTDPRDLREWSLVMAMTGTILALERDLLPPSDRDVVVHASGSYSDADYTPLRPAHWHQITSEHDIARHVRDALGNRPQTH